MKNKIWIILGIIISLGAITAMIYAAITIKNEEKNNEKYLIELTYEELKEKIDKKESFVLVYTQTTCAHCHEYKPILTKTLANIDFYAYEIVLDKLKKEDRPKMNDIANVSGTPTTIFIKDGQEINSSSRLIGIQSEDKIIQKLKYLGYIK